MFIGCVTWVLRQMVGCSNTNVQTHLKITMDQKVQNGLVPWHVRNCAKGFWQGFWYIAVIHVRGTSWCGATLEMESFILPRKSCVVPTVD